MAGATCRITVIVAEGFNLTTTAAFLDPFRVANCLDGRVPFEFRAWPMHPRATGAVDVV